MDFNYFLVSLRRPISYRWLDSHNCSANNQQKKDDSKMCVYMYNSMFLYQLYPQWFIWVSIKNVLQVHTTLNKSACILFWIDNVSIIFQYLSIHIDQMEIVYTVPTKMAMCAEVCYYSSKGFSERLYVRIHVHTMVFSLQFLFEFKHPF